MNRIVIVFALAVVGLVSGCKDKDLAAAKNDLTIAPMPLPNTKAGVKDPSIRPADGVRDPSIRPVDGVRDPSVKPLPAPLPKLGGVPDDSVKPAPKP